MDRTADDKKKNLLTFPRKGIDVLLLRKTRSLPREGIDVLLLRKTRSLPHEGIDVLLLRKTTPSCCRSSCR